MNLGPEIWPAARAPILDRRVNSALQEEASREFPDSL